MILPIKKFLFFIFFCVGLDFSSAQARSEYKQKSIDLNELRLEIKRAKKSIRSSLETIKKSKNDKEQKQVFQEAAKRHLELRSNIKKYNTLREELQLKFPKKNDKTRRKYLPLREVTLEEIGEEVGIDAILQRVKNKMDNKYRSFTLSEESEKVKILPRKAKQKPKNRLRLEK